MATCIVMQQSCTRAATLAEIERVKRNYQTREGTGKREGEYHKLKANVRVH